MNKNCPNKPKDPVIHKIARTREEKESAFRLIYNSYLNAGLCQPNPTAMRIPPHQLLPEAETFISVLDGEVVATISLIADGPSGLPMESLYGDQVKSVRLQGMRVGEITCLADRRNDHRRIIANLCKLTRLMTHFALNQRLDGFVLVSHPKHARFYKRFMAFESIGAIKSYESVCDNLAEPLFFDFASQGKAQTESLARVLGKDLPIEELIASSLSNEEREYFLSIQRAANLNLPKVLNQDTKPSSRPAGFHGVTMNTNLPSNQPAQDS